MTSTTNSYLIEDRTVHVVIQRQYNYVSSAGSSMLKREPHRTEHSPRATSSKNAKNKSNSTTLLAMRNNKETDDSSGRGSCCSSEKDSGYSGE